VNIDTLKILLIEDEIAYADWIDAILAAENLPSVKIKHVKRLQEAIASLSQDAFDAILLDLSLPDSQGMDSIREVQQQTPNIPIVVLTFLNDRELALNAVREGVQDYLIKGKITRELLIRSIYYAIERQRTEVTLRQQALMKKMLDRIRQSLDLQEILDSTVVEVRHFLKADRVLFYRCEAGTVGKIMAESTELKQERTVWDRSMVNSIDFLDLHSFFDKSDNVQAIEDVIAVPEEDIYTLAEHQIRSILTLGIWRSSIFKESLDAYSFVYGESEDNLLPANSIMLTNSKNNSKNNTETNHSYSSKITDRDRLWGMLVAHNYHTPRKWQDWEIEFLKQLTVQVTIAIQQSELYHKLQDANHQLKQLAILDGLTGVANRRYFDRILRKEWQRSAREQKPLSLILCDIDYFKLYNDTYGHPAGDRCLQAVAKVLKTAIKRPADLVARYGGEEFAIILPDTDTQGALFIANQIRKNLANLKLAHKAIASKYITLSIGVMTQTPVYKTSPKNLIARTDKLLYQAKKQGRNCIVIENLN
jgi:two-component system, cell cycle response regulator